MAKRKRRFQWLTALFTLIGLLFFWKQVIREPHLYLFGPGGDSLKNYFTPLYYILYDSNFHFTGMNYPFGEHLAFIDAQPWLSVFLGGLMNGNVEYAGNVIAIINLLMLATIPIAAVYLYRIFSLWQMPNYYSAIVAACIALMSPQVFRMTGHYALAYTCFVPMIWYYAASWLAEKRLSSALGLAFTIVLFGGLHAYYLAMAAAFLLPAALFSWWVKRKEKRAWLPPLVVVLCSVLPLIAFQYWLAASGALEFPDRHSRPYGFFYYTSHIASIFLPNFGPFRESLEQFFTLKSREFEGIAYVGTASILAWLTGVGATKFWFKNGGRPPLFAGAFFFAALGCLLLSMSFPFNAIPSAWIPEQVWQFRGLGRFAWPFYYVFAAGAAWLLYILAESFRRRGQPIIAMGIVVLFLSIWIVEALSAQKHIADYVKSNGKHANYFLSIEQPYKPKLDEAGWHPEAFQAILSFPFFNVGSEEIYVERGNAGLYHAFKASLELNLPIAQTFLGRTSLQQAIALTQLLSHPLIEKKVIKELKDNRPFLLICTGNDFQEDELRIIQASKLILKDESVAIYETPIRVFSEMRDMALAEIQKKKFPFKTIINGDTLAASNSTQFYYRNFNGKIAQHAALWENDIKNWNSKTIDVALWLEIRQEKAAFPVVYLRQYNAEGTIVQEDFCNPKEVVDVQGLRTRAHVRANVHPNTKKISLSLDGEEQYPHELLIRGNDNEVMFSGKNGVKRWNLYVLN